MCRVIDDADRYQVYSKAFPTARRTHRCTECGRTIAPGETYERVNAMYDGEWDKFTTCAHCCTGHAWMQQNCGAVMHENLVADLTDHAEEFRHAGVGLRRILVGMRRQWRWPDGRMMPPPKMPAAIGV